jgi:hypothetical protein
MEKAAIALCVCVIALYLLDAAFLSGAYFASAIGLLSELRNYFW